MTYDELVKNINSRLRLGEDIMRTLEENQELN